jgi:hypothetical protein
VGTALHSTPSSQSMPRKQQQLTAPADSTSLSTAAASQSLLPRIELGPKTDAPMMPQPPFAPGCFPSIFKMHQAGCPIMDCSLDPGCTVTDPSCCAYVNFQVRQAAATSSRAAVSGVYALKLKATLPWSAQPMSCMHAHCKTKLPVSQSTVSLSIHSLT